MPGKSITSLHDRLRGAGLRPTQQRLGLGGLLWGTAAPGPVNRHITVEQLHDEARDAGLKVSLATVYNTLHQFCAVGLLRQVVVEAGRSYFDTNVSEHGHFFYELDGSLVDIDLNDMPLPVIPNLPDGAELSGVDVIVRLRPSPGNQRA